MHEGPKPIFHDDQTSFNVLMIQQVGFSLIGRTLPRPQQSQQRISTSNHAPTVFLDNHGTEADVWAVGMLIIERSRDLLRLPSDLRVLGDTIQSGTLSSLEALERVNVLKESL
jgi:hypothetical protein